MANDRGNRLIALKNRIVSGFDEENWRELALLTDSESEILGHPRLLRSLSFADQDYAGNALSVLSKLDAKGVTDTVADYVDERFPEDSLYVSAKPAKRRITFAPTVFSVPDYDPESDLVAVMMPFERSFDAVHQAITAAARDNGLRALRADSIWDESAIIQDIFNLIFRSEVVVVDFTNKNPNVLYETGIAHTLGKHVVPISQSIADVPFDLGHHRVLTYHPNSEGITKLESDLTRKLSQFRPPSDSRLPF